MSMHSTGGRRLNHAETRLAWALALPALAIIAAFGARADRLDGLGIAAPARSAHAVAAAGRSSALPTTSSVLAAPRFWSALGHTGVFVAATLVIELAAGLLLALALDRVTRARGLVRTAVLLPWAIPTVVAALVWRFMFESPAGLASALAGGIRFAPADVVRRCRRRLGSAGPRRRVEDDAVCRPAAARRTAEDRSIAVRSGGRRRRGRLAAVPSTSRCRC